MTPTAEQLAILTAATTTKSNLLVTARAGAAKTTTLTMIADALPSKLYDTAYALAVEVAAADLEVAQEELRFLQLLRDKLALDKLVVAAIERGARARLRTL